MRKVLISIIITGLLVLSGCGNADKKEEQPSSGIVNNTVKVLGKEETEAATRKSEYDVDLTRLSPIMIYSEVLNMMQNPEDYDGKSIKLQGSLNWYYDESTGYHFACIIQDATACCQQGIEFVLKNNPDSPDLLPEPGSEVTVTGTFQLVEKDSYAYVRMTGSDMKW